MGVRSEVCALAEEVGSDPLLTQGAGGNVSWKSEDVLWIKASGTRLRDAKTDEIFVPVDLTALQRSLNSGLFDASPIALRNSPLRPSIETSLHALLPQNIVLHVHAVDALALLVRSDARERLLGKLSDVDGWALVPYAKPGAELAQALRVVRDEKPQSWAYFLANHGIVVAGSTAEEVSMRLSDLLGRLRIPTHPSDLHIEPPPAATRREASSLGAVQLQHESLDWLVNNVSPSELEAVWALYPDHVVFLGPDAPVLKGDTSVTEVVASSDYGFVIALGVGVFCRPNFSVSAAEQLVCFAEVMRRQDSLDSLKPLTKKEVQAVIGWESEKFRLELAK